MNDFFAYQTCTECHAQTLGECLCAETEEPTDG